MMADNDGVTYEGTPWEVAIGVSMPGPFVGIPRPSLHKVTYGLQAFGSEASLQLSPDSGALDFLAFDSVDAARRMLGPDASLAKWAVSLSRDIREQTVSLLLERVPLEPPDSGAKTYVLEAEGGAFDRVHP